MGHKVPGGATACPTVTGVSIVVTCAQYQEEEVLEADLIGDEEECILRDHLFAFHPKTVQPETLLSPAWHEGPVNRFGSSRNAV